MKIVRSSKCSCKFSTEKKLDQIYYILKEYKRVVNKFIDLFWFNPPDKTDLVKSVLEQVDTWFTSRLRQTAAREALAMVQAVRNKPRQKGEKTTPKKPRHSGRSMNLSSMNVLYEESEKSKEFDVWLHISCIGNGIIFDIPVKLHKHFNELSQIGKRLNSFVISRKSIQFCFEIETGPKKKLVKGIGIDTGINALASLSSGEQYGKEIKEFIRRIKLCEHGSKRQERLRRGLKDYISKIAKEVVSVPDLSFIVVERLKNITKNTKSKNLSRNTRYAIGSWNVRYWLERLESQCERNRVSFRTVSPYNTSISCSKCGYTNRRNRDKEIFKCLNCGYQDNADVQASKNILDRFLSGQYGAGCKGLNMGVAI